MFIMFMFVGLTWFDQNSDPGYRTLQGQLFTAILIPVAAFLVYQAVKNTFLVRKIVIKVSDDEIIIKRRNEPDVNFAFDDIEQISVGSYMVGGYKYIYYTTNLVVFKLKSGQSEEFYTGWYYNHPYNVLAKLARHGYPLFASWSEWGFGSRKNKDIVVPANKYLDATARFKSWWLHWPLIIKIFWLIVIVNVAVLAVYGINQNKINQAQKAKDNVAYKEQYDRRKLQNELKLIDFDVYESVDTEKFTKTEQDYVFEKDHFYNSTKEDYEYFDRVHVISGYYLNQGTKSEFNIKQIKNTLGSDDEQLYCTKEIISSDSAIGKPCSIEITQDGENVYTASEVNNEFKPSYLFVIRPTTIIMVDEPYQRDAKIMPERLDFIDSLQLFEKTQLNL